METIDNNWLAAYLYYPEPWEGFLKESVEPFIRDVMEKMQARQFFFIRYWEKGPHIRLRFKGDPGAMETEIKPRLIEHFKAYYEKHPRERREPDYLKKEDLPEEHRWYPNHTIQFIPYEPEIDRYGGPECIGIAEEHFQQSTEAVLAVIGESEHWDYDRALGAAIQLHLGFAHAMGMELQEAAAFFHSIFNMWFYRSYAGYEQNLPEEELKKRRETTMNAFEENFEKQKEGLLPYHETVWNAFSEGIEFEQEWLNRWLTDTNGIFRKLTAAQKNGILIIPEWWLSRRKPEESTVPDENYQRWAILESYVHMTNNRLGIMNRDEAFLGYLIKECLKNLTTG